MNHLITWLVILSALTFGGLAKGWPLREIGAALYWCAIALALHKTLDWIDS